MDRRNFLTSLLLAGGGLLVGCGSDGQDSAAPASPGTTSPGAGTVDDLIAQVAPEAEQNLSVITGSFEQLTGDGVPFAFGVTTVDNEPVTAADLELYVVSPQGEPNGPYPTEFREVPAQPLGLYLSEVDLEQAGPTSFIVVTADGSQVGLAALQIRTPEESPLPAPGQKAAAVPTPTEADLMGMAKLCTQNPPCGMHEVSLDEALREGRPVAITFATPAYCQTAVCGPSVQELDEVRTSRDWGDIAFIHVEIYSDEGVTVADPVREWDLPSEPWLFTIAGDGTIRGRADGPLLVMSDQLTNLLEQV